MPTLVQQANINDEEDLLHLHALVMELGRWAMVPVPYRVRFAAAVVENSVPGNSPVQAAFSIVEKDSNRYFLRAWIRDASGQTERELLQSIPEKDLPPFHATNISRTGVPNRAYRDMQQFTFSLAHDLKNSLTKLKLALSLLEDEKIPTEIENYIRIIRSASNRFETILLSLNRVVQLGDSSPHVVRKISPVAVFAEVLDEFAEDLTRIDAKVGANLSSIEAIHYIEVHFKSILSNLLSNSIKYSLPSRSLTISVSGTIRDGKAILVFSDNGQGMDLNLCGGRLFQPFTRFSTDTEGSGIGLYIVKTVVERNGGHIEVESAPGQGTTFRIHLVPYPESSD
jgi:signal transduction histidine kinase